MKLKYNFYDLRNKPRNSPLPEDVNEHPESVAIKFGENTLAEMVHHREKRLYGTVMHKDEKTNVIDGQFIFQDGMCIRFKLIEYPYSDVVAERSIHNKNLSLSKTRHSDGEEIHTEE